MPQSLALTVATVLCPLALFLCGCGGGAAESAAASADQTGSPGSTPDTPQAAVVREFLQAVQKGNREAAYKCLTTKALKAFETHDVPFLPSAITSGSYQLGKTVESGSTHFVQCIWTDHEAGPSAQSEKIQWMVKEDDGGAGWRIFGLAVYMEAQGQNMVFNFEQPEELFTPRQPPQEQAAAGAAGTPVAAPPQQATLPQDPFRTSPR